MTAAINAIGFISGVLGIVQFGMDNFATSDPAGSTIRIAVGLDFDNGLTNSGGDLPDVRLWNEAGQFLGMRVDPGRVESGGYGDIFVEHDDASTQQAAYTLFSANDDAICIAYAAITWPNGEEYSWIGDWGQKCGGSWYYSNYFISGTGERPHCLWIDANNDQPQTGFQVHWPEFSEKAYKIPKDPEQQAKRIDYLCNAGPPFKMHVYPDTDPSSIRHWVGGNWRSEVEALDIKKTAATETAYGPSKHPASARFQHSRQNQGTNVTSQEGLHFNRLVIDNKAEHTGRGLCDSPTSFGPDFVDIAHGTFCRMADKTLWPVCKGNDTDNCFNVDLHQLIVGGVATRDSPYENILDWTSN